jgi:hypothetical protein
VAWCQACDEVMQGQALTGTEGLIVDQHLAGILEQITTAPTIAAALTIVATVPTVYLDRVQPFKNKVNRVVGILARK